MLNVLSENKLPFKPFVFVLLCVPVAQLFLGAIQANLGPDPQKEIVHQTGTWALYCLFITLAMSPMRKVTGLAVFIKIRRMLGLFSFFYACLHIAAFIALYMAFEWREIGSELAERPYIMVGFAAFSLMLPLALTSNRYAVRKLGARWHKLHRSVYVIAVLGVWHFTWQVKSDLNMPVLFIFLLSLLLGLRIYWANASRISALNKQ